MKKILNRNNQTSNNTVVMIVIFITTIVLVFLVVVLMFLMLDRKKTAENKEETVISENSMEKTKQVKEQEEEEEKVQEEEDAQVAEEISNVGAQVAEQEPVTYPSDSQTSDETVKYTMYVVNCNNWISLRKSPSTSATRLKEIPLGASCSFIEEASNGFYKVIYNGTTGYALAQYLTTDKSAVTSSAPVVQSESSQGTLWVVNCEEWISLRSSANTSASRLAKIPLGASCEYLGSASNGFYKVRYNGTTGYALSQYLSSQTSSYSSGSSPSTTTLRVVNCEEWISLRSSASTSASRLDKIPLGATCEYLGSASNGFYKVRYNGTTGYALSQYLSSY